MSRYAQARAAFQVLASALRDDAEIRHEVEECFRLLLTRYSTSIRENRFIVGGVAERIIAAAFVAMGHQASNTGVLVTRADIFVNGANLSVKSVFQRGPSSVRLVNVMGESSSAQWLEPTIFVISGKGIGYADPDMITNGTRRSRDAIELPMRLLRGHWEASPQYLVQVTIPHALQDESRSDVASRTVADEILRYTKRLRPFDPRTPSQ